MERDPRDSDGGFVTRRTWKEVVAGDKLQGKDFLRNGYLEVANVSLFEDQKYLWVTLYKQGLRGDPEGRVVMLVAADEPFEKREMALLG